MLVDSQAKGTPLNSFTQPFWNWSPLINDQLIRNPEFQNIGIVDSANIATIWSHLSDRFGHLVTFSVWLINKSDQISMAEVIVVQETTLNKSEGISLWLIATPPISTFGSILICEKDSSGADNTYYWFPLSILFIDWDKNINLTDPFLIAHVLDGVHGETPVLEA